MDGDDRLNAEEVNHDETFQKSLNGRLREHETEQDAGWTEDEQNPVEQRCHHHHHLSMPDQEIDQGSSNCQLCRKKNGRLKAVRRAAGDADGDPEASSWSSVVLSSCRMITPDDTQSPSTESPSSPSGSDIGQIDQTEAPRQFTRQTFHSQMDNRHQLIPYSATRSPGGGHSPGGQRGQLSPRNSSSGQQQQQQQQQQALIQKLQGALSKISPKIFKSTKVERPLSAVGTQDQKILALMWAKKEEEERQRSMREMSHRQWEEEMRAVKDSTNSSSIGSSFRRRRHTGDPGVQRRKDKLSLDVNSGVKGTGDDPQTPCSAHGVSQQQQMTSFNDVKESGGGGGGGGYENLDKGGRTLTKSQLDLRQQKSREKQIQAMERKKSVEQRLEQQRREMEQHLLELKRKQEQDLQRANSVRVSREQQQILRSKLKNLEAQQKQEKLNQMKRQSMIDLSQKQEEIRNKLSQAELKAQRIKHDEARRRRDDLEKRIEQSRQRQDQIENEQRKWQDELLKYQKWKDYQADGLAKENIAKKRNAACSERIQREKLQRENMKRLLSQEEQWLNDVESSIAMKDARIKTVQKEKEEQIQRSRALASAYQRMREELKTHYSMNDLDQVAQKVVLENRLGHKSRVSGPSSNISPDRFTVSSSYNSSTLHMEGEDILMD